VEEDYGGAVAGGEVVELEAVNGGGFGSDCLGGGGRSGRDCGGERRSAKAEKAARVLRTRFKFTSA